MHFTNIIATHAHPIYLPKDDREDILKLVSQHQSTKTSTENTPFRRQIDYWMLCLLTAIADGTAPLEDSPKTWGYKAVDTKEVQLTSQHYDLIGVAAYDTLGPTHDGIDDPATMIDVANRLVGAASPALIRALTSDDLRLSPLEKSSRLRHRSGLTAPVGGAMNHG